MARIKEIDFRRITISLPAKVVDKLKAGTQKGNMSGFIADAVEEKLLRQEDEEEESLEEFMESLNELAIENTKNLKTKKSSLEILREIRYDGKY